LHASKLAQNGATLQEIKELMGHSSIVTTMNYASLLENKQRSAQLRFSTACRRSQSD